MHPFQGTITIQYTCPNCDRTHHRDAAPFDRAGRGLQLALDLATVLQNEGLLTGPYRVAAVGFTEDPEDPAIYACEFVIRADDDCELRAARLDKHTAARVTMAVASRGDITRALDFLDRHGVAILAESEIPGEPEDYRPFGALAVERMDAFIAGFTGQPVPDKLGDTPAPAPKPPAAESTSAEAMSVDRLKQLMGL